MIDAEQIILDCADEQGRVTPDLVHVRVMEWAQRGVPLEPGQVLVVRYHEPLSVELLRSRTALVREIVGDATPFHIEGPRGEEGGFVPL